MSASRHCEFFKANDGQWYMVLGDFEYATSDPADCTNYGPFASEDIAVQYLDNFTNPGGWSTDDSGTQPPPTPCTRPEPATRRRFCF